ncbi:MAG TPA: ABC transporter permease [Galbitalea sp.]
MTTTTQTRQTPHTPWRHTARIGAALAAIITVVVIAFLWPSFTASPKNLPIAIAGPAAQTNAVEAALGKASPDTFAFTTVANRSQALTRIGQRKDYGAIVLGSSPEVLTASAANPAVAQLLAGLAPRLQAQRLAAAVAQHVPASAIGTVRTTDVAPLLATDPRGSTIGASSFPLILGGILGGVIIALTVVGVWRRYAALGIYAVAGSAAITGVLQGWFGGLAGDYFVNAGAIALVLLGIGGVMLGAAALVGRIGVAIGPILFLLGANPISAAALPLEFLASPWGAIGQWFPPGAGATLLRELSYFPKADMTFPWLVLAGWAVLGVVLGTLGHFRDSGAATHAAELEAEGVPRSGTELPVSQPA